MQVIKFGTNYVAKQQLILNGRATGFVNQN